MLDGAREVGGARHGVLVQGLGIGRAHLEAVWGWGLAPKRLDRLPIIEHALDALNTLHALGSVLDLWHVLPNRVAARELPATHV